MRLAGRIAVVTGAGSGFGAGIARRFVAEGALVAFVDINPDAAAAVIRDIGCPRETAAAFACDVSNGGSVAAMVAEVVGRFGGFDVLVNNAAISQQPRRIAKLPEADIDRLFAVNVKSLYHMAVHALPVLRDRKGGCVINIASVTAMRPRPGMTWYNASKAAVISITQSMAAELAADRIRVNAIAPAVGRTPMAAAMLGPGHQAALDALEATIPLGRLSAPDDIAGAAAYLASDDASFVTGVILPVDGGRLVG
jgi:3-oxoacyl-[acyl-carrier protein] reductase